MKDKEKKEKSLPDDAWQDVMLEGASAACLEHKISGQELENFADSVLKDED